MTATSRPESRVQPQTSVAKTAPRLEEAMPDFLPEWAYVTPSSVPMSERREESKHTNRGRLQLSTGPSPQNRRTPGTRKQPASGRHQNDAPSHAIESTPSATADALKQAKQVALRYLGPTARTRAEVSRTLERRGFEPGIREQVEKWLDGHQLLDDAEYARGWIRSRAVRKGLAPRALSHELERKGIGRADIAAALDEYDADESENRAVQLVSSSLSSWDGQDPAYLEKIKRRMFAALQRRGHSASAAQRLVLRAIESHRSVH